MGERRFNRTVANFYSEKCPELSRIMTMKLTNFNGSSDADLPPYLQGKICEHCGTVFNGSNCTFRIKPKRKRRKKTKSNRTNESNKTRDDGGGLPRGSNFLQISCSFCGWKTRHIGTSRVNRGSMRSTDGETEMGCTPETPCTGKTPVSEKWSDSPRGSGTPHSSGPGSRQKKQKTKLKALLAMEKEEAERQTSTPPSLINFLASI